ncbi:g3754 [Coccomyxa elongata]
MLSDSPRYHLSSQTALVGQDARTDVHHITGASLSADELEPGPSQHPWEQEDLADPLQEKQATCSNPLHVASFPADSRHVHPPGINSSSLSRQHGQTLCTDRLRDAPSLHADWTANPINSSELIMSPPFPSRGCPANASELHCSSAATEGACLGGGCARPGAAACPGADAHRPSRAAQLAVKAVALLFLTGFLVLFGGFHWYIHQVPPPGGPGRRGSPGRPARVPPRTPEFSPIDFGDLISAHLGTRASDDDDLLSWEHLAAEHGSAAVVIIGNGDTRPRPVVAASERPVPAASAAMQQPRYSALADAGGEDGEVPVLLRQAAFHWGQLPAVVENSTSEELSVGESSGSSPAHGQPSVELQLEKGSGWTGRYGRGLRGHNLRRAEQHWQPRRRQTLRERAEDLMPMDMGMQPQASVLAVQQFSQVKLLAVEQALRQLRC